MSEKLMHGVFLFTGLELFQTLSAKQLSALFQHEWQQREYTAEEAPDIKHDEANFREAATETGKEAVQKVLKPQRDAGMKKNPGDSTLERLKRLEVNEKETLKTVTEFCKNLTKLLEATVYEFTDLKPEPYDLTNLPHTMEVLRAKLTFHLRDLVAKKTKSASKVPDTKSHIQLDENLEVLRDKIQHGRSWDGLLLELTRKEKLLRDILAKEVNHKSLQHVCVCVCLCAMEIHQTKKPKVDCKVIKQVEELAWNLSRQGVLSNPALEWDGSLGNKERLAIERLGFLLNAYQIPCWFWEIVELVRKLILTGILVVVYQGSPAHLAGSLVTIFL